MEDNQLHLAFLNEAYEDLFPLDHGKEQRTVLARFKNTGKLVVKKQVPFEQGAIYQQLRTIRHPNLIQVHDICYTKNGCIIIEDFVSGQTLEERLSYKGKLAYAEAMHYLRQLLEGLRLIQRYHIVHRDLTPQNILISTDGVIKLLDFGIARYQKQYQKKDTTILGTVGYASPEQFGFLQTDVRTDIYAVGILLNKMLTGKLPGDILVSDLRMRKVVLKCTQIDPGQRYSSIEELQKALRVYKIAEKKKKDQSGESIWPGFRSGVPWRRIVGSAGYGFLGLYSLAAIISGIEWGPEAFVFEILSFILFLWIPFLISTNFLRWDRRIFPFSKMPKEIRITIRIIVSIVVSICGIMLENYVRFTIVGLPHTK